MIPGIKPDVKSVRILVAEDDLEINRMVSDHLSREGYQVESAFNGIEAVGKLSAGACSMVILDIMMPMMDGHEVLQNIRKTGDIPVLILSAKCEETDKVIGLGLGADDYMTKPFGLGELTARVKALLRRYMGMQGLADDSERIIRHLDMEMDTDAYELKVKGSPVSLTAKEFDILKLFMRNPRKVFTKRQLFREVWGEDFLNDDNTVMVHIRKLREKIETDPSNPKYILTVWGIGYKLAEG